MRRLIPFFLCTFVILFAQENKLFWDGYDWTRITDETAGYPDFEYQVKSAYVNGLLDGRLYDYFKTWALDKNIADSLYFENVEYLKTSEIIRGLDNFYKDPVNLYLPIESGIIVVNMYAEQQNLDVIDVYIRNSKQWINDLTLMIQKEDMYKLMQEKQKRHIDKVSGAYNR